MESSKQSTKPCLLLIAEDHPIVRETISLWLSTHREFQIVETTESVEGVSEALRTHKIHVVILDLALGNDDALHKIRSWKESFPKVRFLVLSASRNFLIAQRALDSGAHAFVSKSDPSEELMTALHRVRKGHAHVSSSVSIPIGREKSDRLPTLTRREEEILREVASGRTNRDIAGRLGISGKTVERHRENLKRKLELCSTLELIREAVRLFPSENA